MPTSVIKVAHDSVFCKVAGSIAHNIREGSLVEIHVMGHGAVYCTVKALATATSMLEQDGKKLTFSCVWKNEIIDNERKTLLVFLIGEKV